MKRCSTNGIVLEIQWKSKIVDRTAGYGKRAKISYREHIDSPQARRLKNSKQESLHSRPISQINQSIQRVCPKAALLRTVSLLSYLKRFNKNMIHIKSSNKNYKKKIVSTFFMPLCALLLEILWINVLYDASRIPFCFLLIYSSYHTQFSLV